MNKRLSINFQCVLDFNTSVILCESYKYVSNVCTMNPSLHAMNVSPKTYESVPKSTYYYLIINKLQSLIYYIFYIYYYSNKKKRAVFYFFSL